MDMDIKMLLSDMTSEQFQRLLCAFAAYFIVLAFSIFFICYCAKSLFDLIRFLFRKDKYKNVDFLIVKSYKYISRLRKQVQNAPTDKEFVLLYNRLVGVVGFMVDLRIIRPDVSAKILNVKRKNEE